MTPMIMQGLSDSLIPRTAKGADRRALATARARGSPS
jgi:hypothetical protein